MNGLRILRIFYVQGDMQDQVRVAIVLAQSFALGHKICTEIVTVDPFIRGKLAAMLTVILFRALGSGVLCQSPASIDLARRLAYRQNSLDLADLSYDKGTAVD